MLLSEKRNIYSITIVLITFIVGFLNSEPYLEFMGYHRVNQALYLSLYLLLIIMLMFSVINTLYKTRKVKFESPYWVLLAFALLLKFLLLFLQFPSTFMPGGNNFSMVITFSVDIILIVVLIANINSLYYLKLSIWFFGIGASLSALIPFLFFPEYIGNRVSEINDIDFRGAFWNSSVISYMSVGWLLMSLSIMEKSRLKKTIAFLIFVILVAGGLAGLSRAILLSVVVSTVVYLVFSNNLRRYLKSIIVIFLIALIGFSMFQETVENFQDRLEGGIDLKEESRVDIWQDYLESIPDYFLFGELEGDYKKYSSSVKRFGPHSTPLNWFVQFGIFALIGFIILMLGIYKSAKLIRKKQSKQIAATIYAWLAAYLSIAVINETGFSELSVFGGIGLILAWGKILGKENTNTTDNTELSA